MERFPILHCCTFNNEDVHPKLHHHIFKILAKKKKKKSILEDLIGPDQYRKGEKYHRKAATKSGCNVPYKR